jgi:hypothetical protein
VSGQRFSPAHGDPSLRHPPLLMGIPMHPIHDVDVLLLLATTLASKRRPAELVEILVAADVIQGAIPRESKLAEAFQRLATHGLVLEVDGRFTLTMDAQEIMAGQSRKADTAERIFHIREKLADYQPRGEHPAILIDAERLGAAVLAFRAAAAAAGPKPPPKPQPTDDRNRRVGQWRKRPAGRGRG